jgi:hypothetical protein
VPAALSESAWYAKGDKVTVLSPSKRWRACTVLGDVAVPPPPGAADEVALAAAAAPAVRVHYDNTFDDQYDEEIETTSARLLPAPPAPMLMVMGSDHAVSFDPAHEAGTAVTQSDNLVPLNATAAPKPGFWTAMVGNRLFARGRWYFEVSVTVDVAQDFRKNMCPQLGWADAAFMCHERSELRVILSLILFYLTEVTLLSSNQKPITRSALRQLRTYSSSS